MQFGFKTFWRAALSAAALLALLFGLSACGTTGSSGGGTKAGSGAGENPISGLWGGGSSSGGLPTFKKKPGPNDRPTRVGWLSARAARCGFVFDEARLRASYLAFEQSYGADPKRMQEIQKAYDYALQSTAEGAKQDAGYCTRERVDEIRPELNRYLAGDFRTL